MKTLLPHKTKTLGWILLVPAFVLGLFFLTSGYEPHWIPVGDSGMLGKDLTLTLVSAAFIIGGLLVAFSREPMEDEYIAQIRLESFQWAMLVHFALLLVFNLAVYGIEFLLYNAYNMYTVLILFIARFHWKLWSTRKALSYEE